MRARSGEVEILVVEVTDVKVRVDPAEPIMSLGSTFKI